MNNFLIKTPYFIIQKLIFELVKPEDWKRFVWNLFRYKKSTKKKSSIKKQPPGRFCKLFLRNSKAWNFIKKATPTQVFSGKFCEISKNTFFTEHLRNLSHSFISQRSFMYLLNPFFVRKMDKNHNFAIFWFCQCILYSLLWMYFIDQNINTWNDISSMR